MEGEWASLESHLTIRGKRLFVDVRGPEGAPCLLYLHGGPGQGAYEFMLYQGDRLARHLRVIGLDQRGVLRSDPLAEGEPFGLEDLVEDCEALRRELGIDRWAVLGQSFGGYLAMLYALTYPRSVTRLLFENPSWDLALTSRSVLCSAAHLYRAMGKEAQAAECLAAAAGDLEPPAVWGEFVRLCTGLGSRRSELHVYNPECRERRQRVLEEAPFPDEWWERGRTHHNRLIEEGRLWESLLSRFPQVPCPALLMKGKHDPIPSQTEIDAFLKLVPEAQMVLFEESGHFVQLEEPERYQEVVVRFVTGG
jgi:proline iminopeptidase